MKKVVLTNMFLVRLVLSPLCIAGLEGYVYTPHIERSELELDIKYGGADSNAGGEIAPTLNGRTASCWSAAKRHQANIEYEF